MVLKLTILFIFSATIAQLMAALKYYLATVKNVLLFHCLIPFVTVERNGYKITPLLANHAKWELCYVYHIEKDGKVIFYGHDSGWFPELTWKWLENKPLDIVVFECTYGLNGKDRTDNHMSLETVFAAQEKLQQQGCLHQDTQIAVSHISHSGKLLHHELEAVCALIISVLPTTD